MKHAIEQGTMAEYASGARRSLESAVRTAVMTSVSQTTGEISIANAKELGTDLMEISTHGGARPSHAEWQGQIVSLSGDSKGYLTLSDIGYGTIEGFKGINCRHDWWPFIEGISTRAYTDEELKEYRDETVEYNGEEMSVYEATQRQRTMERQMKETRRKATGYDVLLSVEKSTGVTVKEVGVHIRSRAIVREISIEDIKGALTSPLDKGKIRSDRSQQFVGEKATVAVNIVTGKVATVWRTRSKVLRKLLKDKEVG